MSVSGAGNGFNGEPNFQWQSDPSFGAGSQSPLDSCTTVLEKAEHIRKSFAWAAPWVQVGMLTIAAANLQHPIEISAEKEFGAITQLGCGGWDDKGGLHHIGFDLDVGHGQAKLQYETSEEAIAAARALRKLTGGAAEIRFSKGGKGIHVRLRVAPGAVNTNGRKIAARLAKWLANECNIRCDTSVLGRQNLWVWSRIIGDRGFEPIDACEGAWTPPPEALGEVDAKKATAAGAASTSTAPPWSETFKAAADRETRQRLLSRVRKYLTAVAGAIEGQGGDKHTYHVACILIHGFALNLDEALPLFLEWNKGCKPPWTKEDLQRKLECADKASGERGGLLKDDAPAKKKRKAGPSPADLSAAFLDATQLRRGGEPWLRYYRGEWYVFDNIRYIKMPDTDLLARIVRFLQDRPDTRGAAGPRLAYSIISNLAGLTFIPSYLEQPAMLGLMMRQAPHLIAMLNGIVDMGAVRNGTGTVLVPHTPQFFNHLLVPYAYDPAAMCPTFLRILEQILPDPEVRNLIQEWFGLNLIVDSTFDKFLILTGEGANGKTIVLTVLRELLGSGNYSAVGLEAFNAARTFPLAATIGKLANIVGEIGEWDRSAEGAIKTFVSGECITIERKHRDAFEVTPTARLTFATNTLPRFSDRSDAIWRRLIVVPFQVQTLDPSKQDKRFVTPEYWRIELAGVFNWSIAGLKRLLERGHFVEPKVCIAAKSEYRLDSNPAALFLTEHYRTDPKGTVTSKDIYNAYRKWAEENGFTKPLAAQQFAKEVKRALPNANLSPNVQNQAYGARSRVWTGIAPLQ